MEPNYVLYVFVRTDMSSMNPGKAQAHSGHAANAFIHKNAILPLRAGMEVTPSVAAWMAQTPFGFGTQINLKAPWNEVVSLVIEIESQRLSPITAEIIVDPTYPYIVDNEIIDLIDPKKHTAPWLDIGNGRWVCHRKEETAAYVFGDKRDLEPFLGKYPLHP